MAKVRETAALIGVALKKSGMSDKRKEQRARMGWNFSFFVKAERIVSRSRAQVKTATRLGAKSA